MNLLYLERAEALLSYIPLCILALWCVEVLIGMITINPYGSYEISFVPSIYTGTWKWGRHIRGFTLLSASVVYVAVYYLTLHLRPILRTVCSGLVSLIGLIHYEFWWQVGLQYSIGVWPGQTFYWGVFAACLFMLLYLVNMYVNILDMSPNRIRILVCLYSVFALLWIAVMQGGFYQQFLINKAGMVSDPHGPLIMVDKMIGILMWVTIVRRDKNELC